MGLYLAVFFATMAVDLVPIFAPPAWMIMVFFLVKFDLNAWLVLCVGVLGSALGRSVFSLYTSQASRKLVTREKNQELEFVGKRLGKSWWKTWIFVFLYTLTPLSTTALFTAAGMAKISPLLTVPPFFVGKFVSDGLLVLMGKHLTASVAEVFRGTYSLKGTAMMIFGIVVIGGLLFLDWRVLIERRKIKFKFSIWK